VPEDEALSTVTIGYKTIGRQRAMAAFVLPFAQGSTRWDGNRANKAVLALYFEHFKAPLHSTGAVCALWRSKEDFARDGIPRELLDLFPGHAALIQGKWDERRTFEYRHNGNPDEGLFMCFARL
jgi:hypothetical protein